VNLSSDRVSGTGEFTRAGAGSSAEALRPYMARARAIFYARPGAAVKLNRRASHMT
jgi:hypothetical protein